MRRIKKRKKIPRTLRYRQKTAAENKRILRGVVLLVSVILVIIFFFGDHGIYQLIKINSERKKTQILIAELRLELQNLENEKHNIKYNDEYLMRIAREKIIKDITNQYSKRFLLKIIKFCKDNNIELYCSGYHDDVHDYLSSCKNIKLLPKFPAMDTFTERGDDTRHPHKKHYQLFVDKIKELF